MSISAAGDERVFVTREEFSGSRVVRWRTGSPPRGTLVFCHGFMAQPTDYSRLLAQVASHRIDVIAPIGHTRGFAALTGRRTVEDEVADLTAMVVEIGPVTLSGHSRGGQVAWIVAASASMTHNVVVIDPVDGEGRRPRAPRATLGPGPKGASAVVGTAVGGRCTPVGFDHRVFAARSDRSDGSTFAGFPSGHLIVDMGHGDLLDPRPRWFGRVICGGRPHPDTSRRTVAGILVAAVTGASLPGHGFAIAE
jgi:pimeloyl-ACP methyl ester carboxylesterase